LICVCKYCIFITLAKIYTTQYIDRGSEALALETTERERERASEREGERERERERERALNPKPLLTRR
jgi:hypothetical protein